MARALLTAAVLVALLGAACPGPCAAAEMSFPLKVTALAWNVPAGISYDPAAPIEVTLTLANTSPVAVDASRGQWRVTRTRALAAKDPTSIWDVTLTDVEEAATGAFEGPAATALAPGAKVTVTVRFTPGKYGHFSVLVRTAPDAPWYRAAAAAVVRTPAEGTKPLSPCVPNNCELRGRKGDFRWVETAARYGIKWIRGYLDVSPVAGAPGTFDWSRADAMIEAFAKHGVLLLGDFGDMPGMNVPTLGGKPVTYFGGAKANLVVRPEDFPKLADYVRQVASRYGNVMPAAVVRNEPWEGGSISNYHATGAYYRDLLKTVYTAAHKGKADFIVLANDQVTNFEDNVQSVDGTTPYVDVTSHHTGWHDNRGALQSAALGKTAWETEDWSSHYDAYVVAAMTMKLAGGYAKTNPTTDSGYLFSPGAEHLASPYDNAGDVYAPSAIGQAIATWLHFVEDTDFLRRTHAHTLPRILLFQGRAGFEQKHVAIVIGRFKAYGYLYKEGAGDFDWPQVAGNGSLRVSDPGQALSVYDMSGNALPRAGDGYEIPLTEEPYYVVSSAGLKDAAARLAAGIPRYEGNAFHVSIEDFTRPLAEKPPVRVRVANPLQTRMAATVTITPPAGWELAKTKVELTHIGAAMGEVIPFEVVKAVERPSNQYPFTVKVESAMGAFELTETLHVAVFRQGTITVDGDLADWEKAGAVPVLLSGGKVETDAVEKYWYPFRDLKTTDAAALAVRFAGLWDRQCFYLSAEVRDPAAQYRPSMERGTTWLTHGKPYDYLYWWGPQFPGTAGDGLKIAFDVFRPGRKDDFWIPRVFQRRFEGWGNHLSADYEYDLYAGVENRLKEPYAAVLARHLEHLKNPPDEAYKRGWPPFEEPAFETVGDPAAELRRLMAHGVPRGNAYPFSPRRDRDQGLVPGAQVVVRRTDGGWVYEAAIPWPEMDQVAALLVKQPGKRFPGVDVRFAFYVLNDGQRALSWTAGRSACRGFQILHPTWQLGEGIETLWGFIE
ncbi:MAG: hypothetical protein IMZ66_00305 [Planctomycetes bacterium]|nr:hypothetical protein [Planctomycetota bacterium]